MSKATWGAVLLISALSMRAVAGWVCDGVRVGTDAEALAEQVSANTGAIAALSAAKVDKGVSIVMPMDDAGGANTRWSEWAVGGQDGTNGNWRMGVVNSNFVVQVREAGGWSNVVVFLKR